MTLQYHKFEQKIKRFMHFGHEADLLENKPIPNRAAEQVYLQASLLSQTEKSQLRSEIVNSTYQRLYFLREFLLGQARQEQNGKPTLNGGKFNVKLVPYPENGGIYEYCAKSLDMRDIIRYEVIPRGDGLLVAYGHKTLEATFAKLIRAGGYVSLESPKYIPPRQVLAEIDRLKVHLAGRVDDELTIDERQERLKDLDAIKAVLEETLRIQDSLVDRAPLQKNLAKIDSTIEKMKNAESRENDTVLKCFSENFEYTSSKKWPVPSKSTDVLIGILQKNEARINAADEARKKNPRLPKLGMSKAGMSSFLESYKQELLKNVGTAYCQPESVLLISLFIRSLQFSMAKAIEQRVPEDRINTASLALGLLQERITEIRRLTRQMNAILKDMEAGRISPRGNAAVMFAAICQIGELRKQLAYQLENAKKEAKGVVFDGFDSNSGVILTTLEHNVLRTSKGEADLWKRFLDDNERIFAESLGSGYANIRNSISAFVAQAQQDAAKKREYGDTSPSRRAPKDEMALLETGLYELMRATKAHSPEIESILLEVFSDSKSHLLYKLGGTRTLCSSIEYYLNSERLLAAGKGGAELRGLVEKNGRLFSIFDKYGLKEGILEHLDKFNYIESNALDSDTDAGKLLRLKSKGESVTVNYGVDVEMNAGRAYSFKMTVSSKQYNGSFQLPAIKAKESDNLLFEKPFDEVLFGKKEELGAFFQAADPTYDAEQREASRLERIYGILSLSYLDKSRQFEGMKAKMRDVNSDEYLLSFAGKQRVLNGVMFIPKKGEMKVNDPIRIGEANNLSEAAGRSPEEVEAIQKNIQEYLHLMPQRLMFNEANSKKWEWALECAERIAVF